MTRVRTEKHTGDCEHAAASRTTPRDSASGSCSNPEASASAIEQLTDHALETRDTLTDFSTASTFAITVLSGIEVDYSCGALHAAHCTTHHFTVEPVEEFAPA
jgi:hypothetical protein